MKRAVLNIVADDEQRSDYAVTKSNHQEYAKRCGAKYIVLEYGHNKIYDPAVKYLANTIAADFDQTLYLDVRSVVTDNCPSIFDEVPVPCWGVIDELGLSRFCNTEQDQTQLYANAVCTATGLPYVYLNRHVNSNIMVLPRNSNDFYFPMQSPIHGEYESLDQLWLSINLQLHDAPLKELDRRFCWSWSHKNFFEDMHQAFIVNFAGLKDRLETLSQLVNQHSS